MPFVQLQWQIFFLNRPTFTYHKSTLETLKKSGKSIYGPCIQMFDSDAETRNFYFYWGCFLPFLSLISFPPPFLPLLLSFPASNDPPNPAREFEGALLAS